jgi:hypothetical protein
VAICEDVLSANGLTGPDIDYFIPHQANWRIMEAVAKKLGLPADKVCATVERYGNTSASSVGIGLAESFETGKIKVGDKVLLSALAGGFTWARPCSNLTGRPSPLWRGAAAAVKSCFAVGTIYGREDASDRIASPDAAGIAAPRTLRPAGHPEDGKLMSETSKAALVTGGSQGHRRGRGRATGRGRLPCPCEPT